VLVVLQVLSNPELRAKYDKYGSAALNVEFADASMIFGMLFGSELFEPIVGEFLIASATSKGRELTEKEINHMQVGRICVRWQVAAVTAMSPTVAWSGAVCCGTAP
jgi:DnaJ-class molecular chaperone